MSRYRGPGVLPGGNLGVAGDPGELDVLVVGSGVAGLSAAVRLANGVSVPGAAAFGAAVEERGSPSRRRVRPRGLRIGVLTKDELSRSATRWAQGGIAAVLGGDEDSTDLHLADTLAAGAGLCDGDAVRLLVDEGPERVGELIALGAVFDKRPDGDFARAREGGHSTARVVHAGGAATGAEVDRALVGAVRNSAAALLERWFVLDLVVEGGRCTGVVALDPAGQRHRVRAASVLLATGGAGQLFAVTTNPAEATADGVALALRAGVAVADLEFMQFHPTALHHPAMPRPLLSEALRGHGALIRDRSGRRFVDELAPRDVVSRAIAERMRDTGDSHVWLDATVLASFAECFPTIAAALKAAGLDPSSDWLPIAPAAHYLSGGIVTDLDGASTLPGLWAAGEVACTGVHGANRLASNSLLEGLVFGARAAEAILAGRDGPRPEGVMRSLVGPRAGSDRRSGDGERPGLGDGRGQGPSEQPSGRGPIPVLSIPAAETVGGHPAGQVPLGPSAASAADLAKAREYLQQAMTQGAGVVRDAESLAAAARAVDVVAREPLAGRGGGELANLAAVAGGLLRAAGARTETRGAHARRDFVEAEDALRLRFVHGGPRATDAP